MNVLLRTLSLAGALCSALAALVAIRLAAAEAIVRQDTVTSVQRALTLQGSAPAEEFEQRLADLDPPRARETLEYMVREVNPRSGAGWIELGMLNEAHGNPAAAERSLLKAAQVDHQYLPAWTLANFYFRQGAPESFWSWAVRAAFLSAERLADSDLAPLLQLCDGFEPDPDRLLAHFAGVPRMRLAYLSFLMTLNRWDAAQRVALGMTGDRSNDPYLINFADRQIRAGHPEAAVPLWNAASGLPAIDPTAGKPLSNGELKRAPTNLAFDWRLDRVDGIESIWKPTELVLKIDGSQPERCVMLEQTVYLTPRRYRLRFDYTTGVLPSSGVHWALNGQEGFEIESSQELREGIFELPRVHGMANLQLIYRRSPGTTRTEEQIEIRHLRLESIPEVPFTEVMR
ncbi:MAG TPA: hypothetical protein VMT15_00170 [Bryobacteraceae bacterium]|nr:hypothetical protein [Bryobacteraceae bacterium]